MPTALGVAASVTACWAYRYLSVQMADFACEMRNAVLDLPNYLPVSPGLYPR